MLLTQFDYNLPPELIAQEPAPERDASRLLVLDRASGRIAHRTFSDLPEYLQPGDVLIINDTRVMPARLFGVYDDGKSVEVLLVRPAGEHCWEVMVKPAKFARVGRRLLLACGHLEAVVVTLGIHGRRVLRLPPDADLRKVLDSYGVVPLPPYIKRRAPVEAEPSSADQGADRDRYQTVYAREDGAVAAPTAGLHFTRALLDALAARGIASAPMVLHVGPGTFRPVTAADPREHPMDPEWFEVPEASV